MTKSKGENIVKVLKRKHGISEFTPQFKHWIKQRGFKLISHPSLDLKDVLCLPANPKCQGLVEQGNSVVEKLIGARFQEAQSDDYPA